jgi:hypothetical protein
MRSMNAYQKATTLVGGTLLPLLLLLMRAPRADAGNGAATLVGIALLTVFVHALRNAQTE